MSHNGDLSPTALRDIDRLVDRWVSAPEPVSIPTYVLDQTGERREGEAVAVSAQIPVRVVRDEMLAVEGRAIAWTDRAVLVECVIPPSTTTRRVWVWAGAVKRT